MDREAPMTPVYVVWRDAVSSDSWERLDEAARLELHEIRTLGFLVSEDDSQLVVALNYDRDGDAVSQCIAIPQDWIVKRRTLRIAMK